MTRERRADDWLALVATLLGAALSIFGFREPLLLPTGLGLGLGGALLALRGERRIEGRSWLRAGLTIGVLAVAASLAVRFYAEWIVSQWLAEGAPPGATRAEVAQLQHTSHVLRLVGAACGAAFLLGGIANHIRK